MKTKVYGLVLLLGMLGSCDSFLDVNQKGMVIPQTVEDYEEMLNLPVMFDVTNADLMMPEIEVSNDVFASLTTVQRNGYQWAPYQYLQDENDDNYSNLYKRIYACNEIINHIDKAESTTRNEALRQEVKGQAHADRARCYWALVNLYAVPYSESNKDKPGVSLILNNDLTQKSRRATVGEVYDLICSDLRVAAGLTPENVNRQRKVRATRQGVEGFRARVFLYMNQLDSAYTAITRAFEKEVPLLDYNNFVSEEDFSSSSTPWIGNKTRPTRADQNKEIIWYSGIYYYLYFSNIIYVRSELVDLFQSDAKPYSDLRFLLDYGKKDPIMDDTMYPEICYFAQGQTRTYMISGGELYLLKAEILARRGDYAGATTALNELRRHRFLPDSEYELSATNATMALQHVKNERLREFACTFLSWFDLRRYQAYGETVPTFTRTVGGQTFELPAGSNMYTLSIPRYVIGKNPNIEQNPR